MLHRPSSGTKPYPYDCAQLDLEGPGCDNSTKFGVAPGLHDRHIEDVIMYAASLGYDPKNAVWWGYSEGAAMVSQHVNYLLQRDKSKDKLLRRDKSKDRLQRDKLSADRANEEQHMPRAMVLESNGGHYCYGAFSSTVLVASPSDFWCYHSSCLQRFARVSRGSSNQHRSGRIVHPGAPTTVAR